MAMPMCIYCEGFVPQEIVADPSWQCPQCGSSDFLDREEPQQTEE